MLIGIDPGITGAVAWMSDDGFLVEVADLPVAEVKVGRVTRRRLVPAVLADMLASRRPVHSFLEEVATRPGEGAVGAFAFGRGAGQIEGVLAGMGIGYTLVRPQTWKRDLRLSSDKGAMRTRACQLWPGAAAQFKRVRDDGRAEAALIALYGSGRMQGVSPRRDA